jgi:hypothetical protein
VNEELSIPERNGEEGLISPRSLITTRALLHSDIDINHNESFSLSREVGWYVSFSVHTSQQLKRRKDITQVIRWLKEFYTLAVHDFKSCNLEFRFSDMESQSHDTISRNACFFFFLLHSHK